MGFNWILNLQILNIKTFEFHLALLPLLELMPHRCLTTLEKEDQMLSALEAEVKETTLMDKEGASNRLEVQPLAGT